MRFKRFDFVGGYGDLNSSNSIIRAQDVLTTVVEGIISLNVGWQLDSSRCSSTTDYFSMNLWTSSGGMADTRPALFLKNTISNCKLFIGLADVTAGYGVALNAPHVVRYSTVTYPLHSGFVVSMIPGDSNEEFGSTFDDNFIPTTATKVIGTVVGTSSYTVNYVRNNVANRPYTYFVLCDPYCIMIGGGTFYHDYNTNYSVSNYEQLRIGIAVGRLFGILAHEENTSQSEYGCFKFTINRTSDTDTEFLNYRRSYISIGQSKDTFTSGETISTTQYGNTSTSYSDNGFIAMLFGADGNPRFSMTNCNIRLYPSNYEIFSSWITNRTLSGLLRWCPFEVLVASSDLTTYGVVPGDGFKGYLDTNIIRCGINDYGRLYNNGEWMGFGCGILIKWDSANTDSL